MYYSILKKHLVLPYIVIARRGKAMICKTLDYLTMMLSTLVARMI